MTHSGRSLWASMGALGSVIAASSCCLPVLPFAFAAGAAAGSTFLIALRPYLLALSAALIAFGFYQYSRAKQCGSRPRPWSLILLCFSAAVVILSVLFPQALANLLAG
jgi:hypothetical protein